MFPCEKVFQKKSFNGQKIPTAKSNYIQPLFYLVNGKKSNIASVAP